MSEVMRRDGASGFDGGGGRVLDAVIVGAGFAGLGMGMEMLRSGRKDFLLLERANSVGGTWRDNTYPGCACDVPSHLYSLSFAPNPDWSRSFSGQAEIYAYMRRATERSGLLPHVRFGTEVTDAGWSEEGRCWEISTANPQLPSLRARALITGMGGLIEPRLPAVPGIEDFPGEVFHSARWNHDYELTGKRVAVIGTGASAIQFIPQIQPQVEQLHVFQRTPAWVVRRGDRGIPGVERALYRRFPALQRAVRGAIFRQREVLALGLVKYPQLLRAVELAARAHLRRQVGDPGLRAKLTPSYRIGCKRILISNDFYPAMTKPNVELLTEGLVEVRGATVIGSDGSERAVDAIILGTGFQVTDFPGMEVIRGRGGERLTEAWDGSPQAHRCTTVAGFPNLFVLGGPNIGIGHTSLVEMVEHQYPYVLGALEEIESRGGAVLDVRPEVQRRFIEGLDRKMQRTVWLTGGCNSWYLDRKGRNSTLWPDWTETHRKLVAEFDIAEYEVERPPAGAVDGDIPDADLVHPV